MPEMSLHSIFKKKTQGLLCYLPLMNSDWNIEMSSLDVKQHPAIVLVIPASVSFDVHFLAYPTETQRLLLPSKIDEKNS